MKIPGTILSAMAVNHARPHVHVEDGKDAEASIAIDDQVLLVGEISMDALVWAQKWIREHKDDLLANWAIAKQGQTKSLKTWTDSDKKAKKKGQK